MNPFEPRKSFKVNRTFLGEIARANVPAAAIGLADVGGTRHGIFVLRPSKLIPEAVTATGFRLGHTMVAMGGRNTSAVAAFTFEFYNHSRWRVLINPANALVRSALGAMVRQASGLFLLMHAHRVTVFGSDIGDHNVVGLGDNQSLIWNADTSEADYQAAIASDAKQPVFSGAERMEWICRDAERYLDLKQDVLDLSNPEADA
jgi:hypothetical protein